MAATSTRVPTPEGMIRAGAILTRGGPIDYLRSEIGMDGKGPVTVNRTMETLGHPETLASLRGTPITLGHPDGGVTPDNFKSVVVGAIAGEPRIAGDAILGDVFLGDKEALAELDSGVKELSIGYDFALDDNYATIGPLRINHVALVPRGRAGSGVRVLDHKRGTDMTIQEVTAAFDAAIAKVLTALKGTDTPPDTGAIVTMVKDAMKPALDALTSTQKALDDAAQKTAADKAKADAKTAVDALVKQTRDEERARFATLADAMPFVPPENHDALKTADEKTILVAALKSTLPLADKMSVDALRGALAVLKAKGTEDTLPPGIAPFPVSSTDADTVRLKAIDARAKADMEAYTKTGGV